jgi:hypothetical protein
LIAIAVRREPQWSLDVFVSRQAVFYTTTFMGVGAYLLLMAAGGYYVRQFGGSWGASVRSCSSAGRCCCSCSWWLIGAASAHARISQQALSIATSTTTG